MYTYKTPSIIYLNKSHQSSIFKLDITFGHYCIYCIYKSDCFFLPKWSGLGQWLAVNYSVDQTKAVSVEL